MSFTVNLPRTQHFNSLPKFEREKAGIQDMKNKSLKWKLGW